MCGPTSCGMAHARGKHRPLRGTPETTCHPAQARVGSLTDGLSARCRTPNDVHRRRRGRNTWLDRGGAVVADCRGRRPHAPLSPLFPAPNLPAIPPPAEHVQPGGHDSRHPACLTRSSPVGSMRRDKPTRSNQARVPAAKPCLNRCFAATFPVSPRFGMLSSLCRPQGDRTPLAARSLRVGQFHPAADFTCLGRHHDRATGMGRPGQGGRPRVSARRIFDAIPVTGPTDTR